MPSSAIESLAKRRRGAKRQRCGQNISKHGSPLAARIVATLAVSIWRFKALPLRQRRLRSCHGYLDYTRFRSGRSSPMRKLLVIGIGAGNPDHMTVQAIDGLNRADVLFIPDKGAEKNDLAELRRQICDRFVTNPKSRRVEFDVPVRAEPAPSYRSTVDDWHEAIAADLRRPDPRRACRRRLRRLPDLGRSFALRQRAAHPRARAPQGQCRVRAGGHSRHHRRPGARRQPQNGAEPHRRSRSDHHRPPPDRGRLAAKMPAAPSSCSTANAPSTRLTTRIL